MSDEKQVLDLVKHFESGFIIGQRVTDGYINATSLCKACGKLIGHYLEPILANAIPRL